MKVKLKYFDLFVGVNLNSKRLQILFYRYEIISSGAIKELAHEQSLAKMISDWENVFFITMPYKDTRVPILTQLDDILTLLEEQIVKIQTMRGSAFIKVIENEVKFFYELLLRMQSTIDEWTKVNIC